MPVKSYSLKQHGRNFKLSPNFTLGEFVSKDGSDNVLVAATLVTILQKIRDKFGKAVTINSGYRSEAHNRKIGGSVNSLHVRGMAADIVVTDITPLAVAQYAESIGVGGIGHYPDGQGNFCHVDIRAARYRWELRNGKEVAVPGFGTQPVTQATPNYALIVQQKAGLDNSTMAYLQNYKHGKELLEKLAKAMEYPG